MTSGWTSCAASTGSARRSCASLPRFAPSPPAVAPPPPRTRAANRAELLVRCNKAGKYTLTAGRRPSPFGSGFSSLSWLEQKVVLSLDVKPCSGKASLWCVCTG